MDCRQRSGFCVVDHGLIFLPVLGHVIPKQERKKPV